MKNHQPQRSQRTQRIIKKTQNPNLDEFVKSKNSMESVIPAAPGSGPGQAPESSDFKMIWTPAFAGVTIQETFYETIKPSGQKNQKG
jgi:hypothetical protein